MNQKEIALKRKKQDLTKINEEIQKVINSDKYSVEQKQAMNDQKETTEKAIKLLNESNVTFGEYKAQMGIANAGGSNKKSRSKRSKKSKKSRVKN